VLIEQIDLHVTIGHFLDVARASAQARRQPKQEGQAEQTVAGAATSAAIFTAAASSAVIFKGCPH
jgi:hypothetical protein